MIGGIAVAIGLEFTAAVAFSLMIRRNKSDRILILFAALLVIGLAPCLIPVRRHLVRGLDAMLAVGLMVKLYDAHRFTLRGSPIAFREFLAYLGNDMWLVLARTPAETRLGKGANARLLTGRTLGLALGVALCAVAFRADWSARSFWTQHAAKVCAFYVALAFGTNAVAAAWRLAGGRALDPFGNAIGARTPAEFWRRWNRPAAQFLHEYVFLPAGGFRAPARATFATFLVSAAVHEYLFTIILGRVQGFQTAFFLLNGCAATATLRLRPRGWRAAAAVVLTFLFGLTTGVLFFASVNHVVPFYDRELPGWLGAWDRHTR
jgi:hypothetical protein